jgi:sugar lactone lactonase YvrE
MKSMMEMPRGIFLLGLLVYFLAPTSLAGNVLQNKETRLTQISGNPSTNASLAAKHFNRNNLFIETTTPPPPPQLSNLLMKLIAGTNLLQYAGLPGDYGPATSAQLQAVRSPWVDSSGNVYFLEEGSSTIRKVNTSGIITTVGEIVLALSQPSDPGMGGGGSQVNGAGSSLYSIVGDTAGTALYISDRFYIWKYLFATNSTSVFAQSESSQQGFSGDGGPARDAQLFEPLGIWLTTDQILYVADSENHRIRRISSDGIITTVAGSECVSDCSGYSGDNGPATLAELNLPNGVYMDSNGQQFIAGAGNFRIRVVDTSGNITTFVGSGFDDSDGIPASSASINTLSDVKGDSLGNIYFGDFSNFIIRMVDVTNGTIWTVFGRLGDSGFSSGISDRSSFIDSPTGLWVDSSGVLYFSDISSVHRGFVSSVTSHPTKQPVRKPTCQPTSQPTRQPTGQPTSLPTSHPSVQPLLWMKVMAGTSASGFSGDGGQATSAQLQAGFPWVDSSGNIYIADDSNQRIRKVNSAGIISTFAGSGTASTAGVSASRLAVNFNFPYCMIGTPAGNFLFISDRQYIWIFSSVTNIVSVYVGTSVAGFSGDNGPATSAQVDLPIGLWLTSSGVLYFADCNNNRIRKITPAGIVTTVAGSDTIVGFAGDNGPATSAKLNHPYSVYVDTNGKLFIADAGNRRIRLVDTNNIITTFAGVGNAGAFNGENLPALSAVIKFPVDLKGDSLGNIYIADNSFCIVRRINTDGIISTMFGTPNSCAFTAGLSTRTSSIMNPNALWIDSVGNVYFSDSSSVHRGVIISQPTGQPTGQPTTLPTISPLTNLHMQVVAGTSTSGFRGDNGPANLAQIRAVIPFVDSNGDIFIPDEANSRIRKVRPFTNKITTFAGTGDQSEAGLSGLKSAVQFFQPYCIVGDTAGTSLYISDRRFVWKYSFSNDTVSVFAGNGIPGYSGDNVPATSTRLYIPTALWLTTAGDLYISDANNHRIRKVSNNIITTVAGALTGGDFFGTNVAATSARLNFPRGIYIDTNGKLFIADSNNNRVRVVDTNNIITTFAGTGTLDSFTEDNMPATLANIQPYDVKGDSLGRIYIADIANSIVLMVNTNSVIKTLFGTSRLSGFSGGISPRTSSINAVYGIWVDSMGTVYFSDYNSIRRAFVPLQPTSQPSGQPTRQPTRQPTSQPTRLPTGQPTSRPSVNPLSRFSMQLVAGSSSPGIVGDNGPATSAQLKAMIPFVDADGNIFLPGESGATVRRVSASNGIITIFAGTGNSGTAGISEARVDVTFYLPYSIVGDTAGTFLYISDRVYVWKFVYSTNIVSVFAGTGNFNFGGDGTAAISAALNYPSGLWLTTSGNLYIADSNNHRIRKVSNNIITTVAGSNVGGAFNGDELPATSAMLNTPKSTYMDTTGRLFIADTANNRVRVVTSGIITTFAGTGAPNPFNGENIPAMAANMFAPYDVKGDSLGNIYIADHGFLIIRMVNLNGLIVTLCGIPGSSGFTTGTHPRNSVINSPVGIWVDNQGSVYFSDFNSIHRVIIPSQPTSQPSGQPSRQPTRQPTSQPSRLPTGQPTSRPSVNRLLTNLQMQLVAGKEFVGFTGDNGPATSAQLQAIAPFVDTSGNIYLPGGDSARVRVVSSSGGNISTFAGTGNPGIDGVSGPRNAVNFFFPYSVVGDTSGTSLFISDQRYVWIYLFNESLPMSVFAGKGGNQFSGDGGPAFNAGLNNPTGLWLTTSGVLYIADTGNHRIRKVSNNIITTVVSDNGGGGFNGDGLQATATMLNSPRGIYMNTNGRLFIADTENNLVRVVISDVVHIFAGSGSNNGENFPATTANLYHPYDVKGDSLGNIYIADIGHNVIRMVNTNLMMVTLFGTIGTIGFNPGTVPRAVSRINYPMGIWVDSMGTIYFSDQNSIHRGIVPSPSAQPTVIPTRSPTQTPSKLPTAYPTTRTPTKLPSSQPTTIPSSQPTRFPRHRPSSQPSSRPSTQPTIRPFSRPSSQPSSRPSRQPTRSPSCQPSGQPTGVPSSLPSSQPSAVPSVSPSNRPSSLPTTLPSDSPSSRPTCLPSTQPSVLPSCRPSGLPSSQPTGFPSIMPTSVPTALPTVLPSTQPSSCPSRCPTGQPTSLPTQLPSSLPTSQPSSNPSSVPSGLPTTLPSTGPTSFPSLQPSNQPTSLPTCVPSVQPTVLPTNLPTGIPSLIPSGLPSVQPSSLPSCEPSSLPTGRPSSEPSLQPSTRPTRHPSTFPSSLPSVLPSSCPSEQPTACPSSSPSRSPSEQPSSQPTTRPSIVPTGQPLPFPTGRPSSFPSSQPTSGPSSQPTSCPSSGPVSYPSGGPSSSPSDQPTSQPSGSPTFVPTVRPSVRPSSKPTVSPTVDPTAAKNISLPSVLLNIPTLQSICTKLQFDLTSSRGSLNHPWRNITIEVTSAPVVPLTSHLQQFLQNHYLGLVTELSPPLAVPLDFFQPNTNYSVTVKMCNFQGGCNSDQRKLRVVADLVPTVFILGSNKREITRSQSLLLISSVQRMSCNDSVLNINALKYSWRVSTSNGKEEIAKSTSKDPSRYLLPSYSLSSNQTYVVTLIVSYLNVSASTSVRINVKIGSVKAIINGNTEQMMRIGDVFRVDGSQSNDEDKENLKGTSAGLLFTWSCGPVSGTSSFTSCSRLFNQELFQAGVHSPVLALKANESAVNSKVKITLFVTEPVSMRSDSTNILLSVLPSLFPIITLSSGTALSKGNQINPSQSLQLKANINFTTTGIRGNLTWLSSNSLNLSSVSTTPVSRSVVTSLPLTMTVYLSLPSNSLLAGRSYSFGLRCQLENNIRLTNFITVAVNTPPSSGKFEVSPSSGTAYLEFFVLTCSKWIDLDLPLSYQFSFLSLTGRTLITKSLTPLSYFSTVLPEGLRENGQFVTCQADVYDSLYANTSIFIAAQVHSLTKSNISQLVHQNIDPRFAIDLDDLIKGVNIASSLLNQPNCTLSPNCTALNRFPCLSTSHTCGPCQGSFFSSNPGDGNELCVKDTANLVINNHPKKCYLNCSDRGSCIYSSHITGKRVENCFEGDLSCFTSCSCQEGYEMSNYCEVHDDETKLFIQLRELVVDRIIANTKLQDPTEQAVSGWMNSLLEIAQVPNQISENSLSSLLDLSNNALNIVSNKGYETSATLSRFIDGMDSLSAVIPYLNSSSTRVNHRRRLNIENEYSRQVTDSLRNYSQLIVREMVPGQSPMKTTKTNFKLYIQNLALESSHVSNSRRLAVEENCASNETIALPQSLLERNLKLKSTVVTLPTCVHDAEHSDSLQLSVISLSTKLYEHQSFTSSPLTVALSSLPCSNPAADSCRLSISMQSNNEGRGAVTMTSVNRTIECHAGEMTNHTVNCPNHKNYTVSCRGKHERMIFRCPSASLAPTCNGLFAGSAVSDVGCQVKSSGNQNISCSCPLVTSKTVESPQITVVALLTSVEDNFLSTIFSAGQLNENTLAQSWEAIVTITLFLGGVISFMFFSVHADKEANKKVSVEEKLIETAKVHSVYQQKLLLQGRLATGRNEMDEINLFNLAEEALPQLLSSSSASQSWKGKIWSEEKKFHRWLGIIYYFSAIFPRILRVVSLASNIIIMLFIQSLTYNYTHGDDGSCELLITEETCVAPRSYYGTGGSLCYWQSTTSTGSGVATDQGECKFVQPENSMEIMLFVAVFSGLVSAPLAVFIDWIIHKILAAPEINELLTQQLKGKEMLIAPRTNQLAVIPVYHFINKRSNSFSFSALKNSFFTRRSSTIIHRYGQFIDKDYHDLLNELLTYRKTIRSDKEHSQEMDRLWGFSDGNNSRAWEDEPAVTQAIAVSHISNKRGFFRRIEDFLSSAVAKRQSIAKSLQQELSSLYDQLEKEKIKFELLKTETAKSKRLLFLFQKDLIPGITGEILESKEQRDNVVLQPVSSQMKMIGWIFLGGMDLGMLFYVFLFAVSQDSHRQVAWGRSLGIYLFLDIVLISTLMVIFMHVLLPSLIMRDVGKIKKKMIESIERFYEKMDNNGKEKEKNEEYQKDGRGQDEEDKEEEQDEHEQPLHLKKKKKKNSSHQLVKDEKKTTVFNAAKYLFLSYHMAELYPDLSASQLILQYSSPWPKQDYKHIKDVKKNYSGKFTSITRAISIIVIFLLTNLLASPIALQDMIVQTVTTAMIGYTVLIHIQLYFIGPAFVMIPTLTGMVLFYLIREDFRVKQEVEEKKKSPEKEINAFPMESTTTTQLVSETTTNQLPIIVNNQTRRQSLQQGLLLVNQVNERIQHNDDIIEEDSVEAPATKQPQFLLSEAVKEEQQLADKVSQSLGSWETSDFDENPTDINDFPAQQEAKPRSEEKEEEGSEYRDGEDDEDDEDDEEEGDLSFRSVSYSSDQHIPRRENNSRNSDLKKEIVDEETDDTKKKDERQDGVTESRSDTNDEDEYDDQRGEENRSKTDDHREAEEEDDLSDFIFTPSSSEDDDDEDD